MYKEPISAQTRQVAHAYSLSKSWRQEVAQLETTIDYILDLRPAWDTSCSVSKLANKQRKTGTTPRRGAPRPSPTRQDSANSTSGTQGMRGQELSPARLGSPAVWLCWPLSWDALAHCLEVSYILWARYPLMT